MGVGGKKPIRLSHGYQQVTKGGTFQRTRFGGTNFGSCWVVGFENVGDFGHAEYFLGVMKNASNLSELGKS